MPIVICLPISNFPAPINPISSALMSGNKAGWSALPTIRSITWFDKRLVWVSHSIFWRTEANTSKPITVLPDPAGATSIPFGWLNKSSLASCWYPRNSIAD